MFKLEKKVLATIKILIPIIVIIILLIPIIGNIIKNYNTLSNEDMAEKLTKEINDEGNIISTEEELLTFIEKNADKLITSNTKDEKHFWYSINNNKILYTDYQSLLELVVDGNVDFDSASLRSGLVNGFYLMDQKGNKAIEYLNTLEKNCGYESYEKIIKDLKVEDFDNDNALTKAIYEKLIVTAIINDNGIFASASQEIKYVYISPFASTIRGVEHLYGIGTLNVASVKTIKLPKHIKVNTKGLMNFVVEDLNSDGLLMGSTEIHINAKESELKDIFYADATNCVIVLPNGNRYTIEGNRIKKLPNSIIYENLEYSKAVSNFKITLDENIDPTKAEIIEDILCVAYDLGEFKLIASDFVDEDGNLTLPSGVKWKVNKGNEYLECIDEDEGLFKIKKLQPINVDSTIEILAIETSEEGITITQALQVKMARIVNIFLQKRSISNITKENDKFLLSYSNSKIWVFDIKTVRNPGVDETNVRCDSDFNIWFENPNMFDYSIEDGVLRLIGKKKLVFGENIIYIKCNDVTYSFDIELVDSAKVPFTISENADVEDYGITYHIGKYNAVELGKLFKTTGEINVDELEIKCYDTDGSNTPLTIEKDYFLNKNAYWFNSTIKFASHISGEVIISIGLNSSDFPESRNTSIKVDVVEGYNVTDVNSWKEAKSRIVLLNDISLGNKLDNNPKELVYLYGNYHKIDATLYEFKSTTNGDAKFIGMNNGTMECTIIEGPTFDEIIYVYTDNANGKYTAGIRVGGNTTITNCYISGFRNPVVINNGDAVFNNTTIVGGSFTNIWIMDCDTLTFNGGKTIQIMEDGRVGAGIVVNPDSTGDGIIINADKDFKQYNYVSEHDISIFEGGIYKIVFAEIFEKYPEYVHEKNGVKYINSGIILHRELIVSDLKFEYIKGELSNKSIVGYSYSKIKLYNSIFGQQYETGYYGDVYSPICSGNCLHSITPDDSNEDGVYNYIDFLSEMIIDNK